jgi:hypothetical protein
MKTETRTAAGINATVAYLRTEFPDESVGHCQRSPHEHHFFVGKSDSSARHWLLIGSHLLDGALPLNVIVRLQDADVGRLLREAGSRPVRV